MLGKVEPFFHCQTDDPFLQLPPERPVLGKTSLSLKKSHSSMCWEGRQSSKTLWDVSQALSYSEQLAGSAPVTKTQQPQHREQEDAA